MSETGTQRLADVGAMRVVTYALLVGGAAYLVAATVGPNGWGGRLVLALLVAICYAAIVGAVGAIRRRRPVR